MGFPSALWLIPLYLTHLLLFFCGGASCTQLCSPIWYPPISHAHILQWPLLSNEVNDHAVTRFLHSRHLLSRLPAVLSAAFKDRAVPSFVYSRRRDKYQNTNSRGFLSMTRSAVPHAFQFPGGFMCGPFLEQRDYLKHSCLSALRRGSPLDQGQRMPYTLSTVSGFKGCDVRVPPIGPLCPHHSSLHMDTRSPVRGPRASRLFASRATDAQNTPATASRRSTGFLVRVPSFVHRLAAAAMYFVPNLELLQTFLPFLTTMLPSAAPLWTIAARCLELYSRIPCASLLSFGAPYTLLIKKKELFKPSYFLRHHTMTALLLSMLQYTLSMIYLKGVSASVTGTAHETIVLSLFITAQTLLLSSMFSALSAKYAWVPVVTEAVTMHIGEKPSDSY
ncbi:TIC20 [Toxoplasma gondii ME49]|uniref:TIC20 n=4 Tax=Toxoplasma gondii TaxID=5811 RepID=A0A125YJV4_TOXGV|nr:TIC20 [Toxoplasma gondii ME49]EPT29150.1 TIC20 [Toxoplasma gondii ME49]ESS35493.1 TIC20 [Toxoplasma gondii VEG]KYF45842.1 TIC20 [Toxoplasma gondii ARI]|eukprot:XP_002364865.2 TIC20 [Toxoplasma gondii ME49]